MMKNWLDKYFSFTKREYNGLLVLMAMLLLISMLPYVYEQYLLKAPPLKLEEKKAIAKLILIDRESPKRYWDNEEAAETVVSTHLFRFDPNKIDLQQWQKLGLTVKQAQAILNYRNKGGKFYQPSDLQRMYTITPEKFAQLAPYIRIEKTGFPNRFDAEKAPTVKKAPVLIAINSADTAQLDQVKGIGAAFARRIVNYRTKLGGFYKKEQLMEVFGLDSMKFNEIKDQISLDPSTIQQININIADFEALKRHPYLSFKQINAILQYRKQHGKYNSLDDLKKVAILTPQTIQNLAPYLIF